MAIPRPTLGHSQGDTLTNPMLITVYVHIWPEGHREPRNKVGSLSLAEHPTGFELGTFRFLLQRLNPLGHSPLFLIDTKHKQICQSEKLWSIGSKLKLFRRIYVLIPAWKSHFLLDIQFSNCLWFHFKILIRLKGYSNLLVFYQYLFLLC